MTTLSKSAAFDLGRRIKSWRDRYDRLSSELDAATNEAHRRALMVSMATLTECIDELEGDVRELCREVDRALS